VKVFVSGELLAKQAGASDGSIGVNDQAAIRFFVEKGLPNSKDYQWIDTAANNGQNYCGQERTTEFG
jgi:hypothetical protein